MKTKLKAGMRITLLAKDGSQLADSIVLEVTESAVVLDNGDSFLIRHIASEKLDACTVQLSVSGWL